MLIQRNNRNNLWARYRRLFNLLGSIDVPQDSLVTLAGDTREPGVPLPGEGYRRFSVCSYYATMNVGWHLKYRADADLVIERFRVTWSAAGNTSAPLIRLASPAQVAAEALAYLPVDANPVTSASGAWRDYVDGLFPPVSHIGGAVGADIGSAVVACGTTATSSSLFNDINDVHLPAGAGISLDANQSLTNVTLSFEGYITGRN